MTLRGVRGATCLSANDAREMSDAVGELLTAMLERNSVDSEHVISIILTGTPDLTCAFPAAGARAIGLLFLRTLIGEQRAADRLLRPQDRRRGTSNVAPGA